MPDCCDPTGYQRLFDAKEAGRRLRSYRKKGLDPMARSMVDYLVGRGVEGADLLEVGGGVGDLQVELLKAGVTRCVNVELSDGYEAAASELLESEGFEGRVVRHLGDFVERRDEIAEADIVVLNRVVCCYPWMEEMMAAAVEKTRRFLALSFPRDRLTVKTVIGLGNVWHRIRSCGFRAYVHPVAGIESAAAGDGLERRHTDRSIVWEAAVFERPA